MLKHRFVVRIFSIGLMVLGVGGVCGQDYPNKPIRIVTSEPGGGTDFASRLIAQGISGPLGQPVIVENRSSRIFGELVSKALPDGYTMLLAGNLLWITPLIEKTSYDPVRDFSPITVLGRYPNVLVVHPSLPVKSVKELIALAKAAPGELNYGAPGAGSSGYLAMELFKASTGVNIVHVPYKGAGPALNALIGGEVRLTFGSTASVTPHIKSGKLRALAVTSAQASALAPGLPTVAASGVPGYEAVSIYAMLVPAKTPRVIIGRLNHEIVRVLNNADVKEKLFSVGVEIIGSSPQESAATIKSDIARVSKLIKVAGIKVQ